MIRAPLPHGFTHAPDWQWAQIGCSSCGFHERWEDLRAGDGEKRPGKAARAAIRRDMLALLRTRGCTHV